MVAPKKWQGKCKMIYHCSTCGYTGDDVFSNWDEKELESCIICQKNKNAKLFIEHLHIICPVCNGILEKMKELCSDEDDYSV